MEVSDIGHEVSKTIRISKYIRRVAYLSIFLVMETANISETSVNVYQATQHNIPETVILLTSRFLFVETCFHLENFNPQNTGKNE